MLDDDDDNLTDPIEEGAERREDEKFIHHQHTADKGQTPLRVDKFLMDRIEGVSRSKIQQAAEADCILVNGQPVKSNYKIKPLDVVA